MIIGGDRLPVIENIRKAAEAGDFYRKVELNDPVLTEEEAREITDRYVRSRDSAGYKFKSFLARRVANFATWAANRDTEIVGAEKLPELTGGAIITSNHFGPLENTVIRKMVRKYYGGVCKDRLYVVSQTTNFAMKGVIGFLMNYADTVPLSRDFRYLTGDFLGVLRDITDKNGVVLIYPEQEMWFNYKKPRPLKRGAYHFAAKLGVPVISCFVEMTDTGRPESDPEFNKVGYRLHILGTLYPDSAAPVKDESVRLCRLDYDLKKTAYENAYGEKLDYRFDDRDIAGFMRAEGDAFEKTSLA
ncbi:MAG: 1-acyl-sn-glycerol-3-phosphate acyltransferase [Clostridia bacterium]|nr:1-acyl-sn-glycerol-3-phosphate acyltransferase [Clostridia bacterium]